MQTSFTPFTTSESTVYTSQLALWCLWICLDMSARTDNDMKLAGSEFEKAQPTNLGLCHCFVGSTYLGRKFDNVYFQT